MKYFHLNLKFKNTTLKLVRTVNPKKKINLNVSNMFLKVILKIVIQKSIERV